MRASGVRGVLVYCTDERCDHWNRIDASRWPDHLRLSEIARNFVCMS